MAILAPAKCPKCGCPTLTMQIIAWGLFKGGEFQTFDVGEHVSPLDDVVTAVCDNEDCGHEWEWEQIP